MSLRLLAASLTCALSCALLRAEPLRTVLTVRVYDTARVSARAALRLREVAAESFAHAGVGIAWRECGARGRGSVAHCENGLSPLEVAVRLVNTPTHASLAAGVLGYAHVDGTAGRGVLATVLVDRIRDAAPDLRLDEGTLLGYVLGHEVAHLVLGTIGHSDRGLLRTQWGALGKDFAKPWRFSEQEAMQLQQNLAVWARDDGALATRANASP